MSAAHDLAVALIASNVVALDAEGGVWLAEELVKLEGDGWTFVPPAPADAAPGDLDAVAAYDRVLTTLERLAPLRRVLRAGAETLPMAEAATAIALNELLDVLEDLELEVPDAG